MRHLCSLSSAEESVSSNLSIRAGCRLNLTVYIFIGSILLSTHWTKVVPGTLVGFIGLGYVALEFIPSIEPPANMR